MQDVYTGIMNSNFESSPEDRRLTTDSNQIGMEGAHTILRRLKYLQREGPNKKPQTAVAEDMETGQSAVSEMLGGKVVPRLDTAVKLAHVLGATIEVVHPLEEAYVNRQCFGPTDDLKFTIKPTRVVGATPTQLYPEVLTLRPAPHD